MNTMNPMNLKPGDRVVNAEYKNRTGADRVMTGTPIGTVMIIATNGYEAKVAWHSGNAPVNRAESWHKIKDIHPVNEDTCLCGATESCKVRRLRFYADMVEHCDKYSADRVKPYGKPVVRFDDDSGSDRLMHVDEVIDRYTCEELL